MDDNIGFPGIGFATLYTYVFHLRAFALTGGGSIYKSQEDAPDIDLFLYSVECGPCNVDNNSGILIKQGIKQCPLAGVGFAYDGDTQTVFNGIAQLERGYKLFSF